MTPRTPTLVHARGRHAAEPPQIRIEEDTLDAVLDALDPIDDLDTVVVVVDVVASISDSTGPLVDHDEFIAVVSVLVMHGVRSFETRHPQPVRRVLDMHTAIVAGEIEILES